MDSGYRKDIFRLHQGGEGFHYILLPGNFNTILNLNVTVQINNDDAIQNVKVI